VAFGVALDMLHWAMSIALYRCIAMAIKTTNNLPAFPFVVDSVVAHNHS
jgi:hypothetical protein